MNQQLVILGSCKLTPLESYKDLRMLLAFPSHHLVDWLFLKPSIFLLHLLWHTKLMWEGHLSTPPYMPLSGCFIPGEVFTGPVLRVKLPQGTVVLPFTNRTADKLEFWWGSPATSTSKLMLETFHLKGDIRSQATHSLTTLSSLAANHH